MDDARRELGYRAALDGLENGNKDEAIEINRRATQSLDKRQVGAYAQRHSRHGEGQPKGSEEIEVNHGFHFCSLCFLVASPSVVRGVVLRGSWVFFDVVHGREDERRRERCRVLFAWLLLRGFPLLVYIPFLLPVLRTTISIPATRSKSGVGFIVAPLPQIQPAAPVQSSGRISLGRRLD